MKNILLFTKIEIKKYIRQPMVLAFGVVFPIFWVIMNGAMFKNEPSPLFGGIGTVDFMFPAFIFLIILVAGLSSLPLVIAKNYELKAIRRYSFAPVKRSQYLMALYLGSFITVIFPAIVMYIVAFLTYDILTPSLWGILLMGIAILVISVTISSLGILLASTIKGFQSTLSVSFLLYFVLLFISGASVPMPVLPDVIQQVSNYIPFARMVRLLQNIWHQNTTDLFINVSVTALTSAICFGLALLTFKWSHD